MKEMGRFYAYPTSQFWKYVPSGTHCMHDWNKAIRRGFNDGVSAKLYVGRAYTYTRTPFCKFAPLLSKYHDRKTYEGTKFSSTYTSALSKKGWVVSLTFWPLYSKENNPYTRSIGGWACVKADLDAIQDTRALPIPNYPCTALFRLLTQTWWQCKRCKINGLVKVSSGILQ